MKFKKTSEADPAKAFIEAAAEPMVQQRIGTSQHQVIHPWDSLDPKYRDKRIAGVNLRLTETELSKLQYIKTHTNKSIQAFIMGVLTPVINEEIEKIDAELMGGKNI